MRIESRYAEALTICAELATENAALRAEQAWSVDTIRQLVEENIALNDDLGDLQAAWAAEHHTTIRQAQINHAAAAVAMQACDEANERANMVNSGANQKLIELSNKVNTLETIRHDHERHIRETIAEVKRIATLLPENSAARIDLWTLANRLSPRAIPRHTEPSEVGRELQV